jgi:hypothetical protein
VRRQPLTTPVRGFSGNGGFCRSWWWAPGGRNKGKAKRRSARRERARARREIAGQS